MIVFYYKKGCSLSSAGETGFWKTTLGEQLSGDLSTKLALNAERNKNHLLELPLLGWSMPLTTLRNVLSNG